MNTISTHYIDGAFGAPHGREVTHLINPTNGTLIGQVRQYTHCADRRNANGQTSLFIEDAHFAAYMNAKAERLLYVDWLDERSLS
jgi:hypothetical protein